MPARADVCLLDSTLAASQSGSNLYVIQTPEQVLYCVYINGSSDVVFAKSSDGGLSWGVPVTIFTGTAISVAVWYDKWSGLAGGLIHVAYTETGTSDTLYRTINTESADALSTQTVIFAGASAVASGGGLSICRARGGNVYCRTTIDAGVEGGFFRLPNANVPNGAWDAARTIDEALATTDQFILLPGWAADNQDMIMIFWDASADEISRKIYDNSANTWAEASIATTMVDVTPATNYPHFAAAVDITNSQHILIAWSAVDLANADLRCWKISETFITEVTNVVLNSTDNQGFAAIGIETNLNWWYAFYAGKSDGSETFNGAMNVYYKVSKDSGVTWGAETKITLTTHDMNNLATIPRFINNFVVYFHRLATASRHLMINAPIIAPRTSYRIGI